MSRENKVKSTFTISPRLLHYLSQLAEMESRSNSNMIERLVEREFERLKDSGVKFELYPGDRDVIGKGKDEALTKKYNQFVAGKKSDMGKEIVIAPANTAGQVTELGKIL